MEEVRSYWQVASITHFCTLFQKPFKLPIFEPEELEQAFILDIPVPQRPVTHFSNHNQNNHIKTTNDRPTSGSDESSTNTVVERNNGRDDQDTKITNGTDRRGGDDDDDNIDDDHHNDSGNQDDSPDYKPPKHELFQPPPPPPPQAQQQNDEQELHLLVKLAIALLKPHFNSKISALNWENYLGRLIDLNWVELENCPSPFNVPLISPDGIELTKNLTFNELSLSDKIDVFSALCDYRFWCGDASDLIKDYPIEELRLESAGKDQQGYEYWYFSGTRLFRENKELTQDLIFRKKRIKELEYKLIEHERARILKEKEELRRAEIERAKQLANEAREARMAIKRQQEQDAITNSKKKRTSATPVLPPRTGLRERRSSAASNNNETETSIPARTLRSRAAKQQPNDPTTTTATIATSTPQNTQKTTRGSAKNAKDQSNSSKTTTPEPPKISPEEECKQELELLKITLEERKAAWQVYCESLEEWESFATKFEKTKSSNEKYLSRYINESILPIIQSIYAKRAAEIRRKEKELLYSLATRRVSTRIISKRAQEEEEERQAQIREAEIQKKKAEAEVRLKAELEREMRAKRNRFVINGETSSACSEDGQEETGRYNLRQHQQEPANDGYDEFDGIIHPDKLSEFYEALELIVDTVRTSKHAWPFVDAVPETVPGYYDLIEEPTDLKKIRTKVEFREYRSLIQLERDFQLLVNNCEKFNGPKNVYTKMVYRLWKSFRKNVQLYLQRDLHMDESETFIFPPAPPQPPPIESHSPPPPPPPQTHHDCPTTNGISKQEQDVSAEDVKMEDVKVEEEEKKHMNNLDHKPEGTNHYHHHNHHNSNHIVDKNEPELETNNYYSAQDDDHLMDEDEEVSPPEFEPIDFKPTHDQLDLPDEFTIKPEVKPNLQFQPTPVAVYIEQGQEPSELPPEPIGEEVIVEEVIAEPEDHDTGGSNNYSSASQNGALISQVNQ